AVRAACRRGAGRRRSPRRLPVRRRLQAALHSRVHQEDIVRMTTNISFVQLILEASLVVQLVMLLLLLASIASWAAIFQKRRMLGDARADADTFEKRFWSGIDLAELYK